MDHLGLHYSNRLSLSPRSSLWSYFQTQIGVGQSTGGVRRRCRRTWVGLPHAFACGGNTFEVGVTYGALHLEYTFVARLTERAWVNKTPSTIFAPLVLGQLYMACGPMV